MSLRAAAMLLATTMLVSLNCAAPAGALTPPTIDAGMLPDPVPPAPPERTVQRQTCSIPTPVTADQIQDNATNPLAGLQLEAAWQLSRGEGQRVAVIDTGVAPHPRLASLEAGGDYVSTGDGTQDCDGHGTIVAGLIAAAPDTADPGRLGGVAPAAAILSIRQSSIKFSPAADPTADGYGDVDTLAKAVRTAADRGATVINISSVACQSGSLDDRALGAALAYAVDVKDVVVVAAAGNIGGAGRCPDQPDGTGADWATATVAVSPAWYDDYVLTVGSAAADGSPSSFTLPGPWVDVGAPGESLVSLNSSGHGLTAELPGPGGAVPISGTSYAAPLVSGVVALIRARFPELSARQVMQRVESTARRPGRGWEPFLGNGPIDPIAALDTEAAATPTSAAATPLPEPRTVAPAPAETRGRNFALAGAAGCLAIIAVALTLTGHRRSGPDIAQH